jgi:hypothetical protein
MQGHAEFEPETVERGERVVHKERGKSKYRANPRRPPANGFAMTDCRPNGNCNEDARENEPKTAIGSKSDFAIRP